MKRAIFYLLSVSTLVFFQNCSNVGFTASEGNASSSLGPDGYPPGATALGPDSYPTPFTQTNCTIGYPFASANPKTSLIFNESDVLVAFSPANSVSLSPGLNVNVWYSDEHALALGVRRVIVKAANGTSTTTDYPISPLNAIPGAQASPQVGSTIPSGDQAGTDVASCAGAPGDCYRPMWPALFVTDITANATSLLGDWQSGGTGVPPTAVYGTWKGVVKTVDYTRTPASVSIATDTDPARNNLNLGNGIPFPPGGANEEGFSAVVSWDVSTLGLQAHHSYRLQFMVHDGDQNKGGGDVGENCVNITLP